MNKMLQNMALGAVKKYIKENKVSFIVVFIDDKGEIGTKVYTEPMAIIKKDDYDKLINKSKENG